MIGENGVIKRTQEARLKSEESSARETLELMIGELSIRKKTDKEYNESEYIDNKLEEEGIIVIENDIVVVDGWKFEIDRSIPKIKNSLGKGEINTDIKIELGSQISTDYVKSAIRIEISYEGEISNIYINETELNVPEKQDGKYVLNAEVVDNGKYTIMVQDKEGKINIKNITISEITEDMDIYNKADMEKFRNMVNEGRTFEGKTARVMEEINLEGSEENKWTPIGDYTKSKVFKGTFEGNGHTINNLYINATEEVVGLFGVNVGNINNVIINGSIKSTSNHVGGIMGFCGNGGTVNNCINEANVTGNEQVGGIVGSIYGSAEITNCINKAIITGVTHTGGIVGGEWNNTKISKCENKGEIIGNDRTGGIAGTAEGTIEESSNQKKVYGKNNYTGGIVGYSVGTISKCSNIAEVQGTYRFAGGIAGYSSKLVTLSFNMGSVKITTWCVGGITGENAGMIQWCYNTGSVNCSSYYSNYNASWSGGITAGGKGNVYYCYNIGTVYAYSRCVGGIIGGAGDTAQTIQNCYNAGSYSQTKSGYIGTIYGQNKGGISIVNSTGITKDELQKWNNDTLTNKLSNNFIKDEKNNDGTWKYNNGYPILKWQVNQ